MVSQVFSLSKADWKSRSKDNTRRVGAAFLPPPMEFWTGWLQRHRKRSRSGVSAELRQCSASTAPDETGNVLGIGRGSGL